MIVTLTGIVQEKLPELVVLDVSGVGYGVYMPAEDMGALHTGQATKVYVYEHIRENGHDLFGFTKLDTKHFFEQLLGVNGVGPKMGLSILHVGSVSQVRQAIASGDTKFIQAASGVGKRLAERLVVELKDKVGLIGIDLEGSGLLQSEDVILKDEAVAALIALGFSSQDAATALQGIDASLSTAARVKLALREKA